MAALEQAALDGSLFRPDHRTLSDRGDSDDDQSLSENEDAAGDDYIDSEDDFDNTVGGRHNPKPAPPSSDPTRGQIEHNGHQTGVKGVQDEHKATQAYAREQARAGTALIQAENGLRGMQALTVHEESALVAQEAEEDEELREIRRRRREQRRRETQEDAARWERERVTDFGFGKSFEDGVKNGALREIGSMDFVEAVERDGWALVFIYEPNLPRCDDISSSLLHLKLNLPYNTTTSIYRARATSLGFSLLPPIITPESPEDIAIVSEDLDVLRREIQDISARHKNSHKNNHDSETAIIADLVEYVRTREEKKAPFKGKPDLDVLPTLLAYKDGELEKTWIRVDWEVGQDGVVGLLRREGILPSITSAKGPGINRRPLAPDSDDDE
ncbi:hypothetical protein B9479_000712 [Cryptococcus floricola]|uniref:Phosducin thioredoxin-like domain-containing protein n=1 Tax=Cryptococcus floricola TaxID=2591691 RepID=A0A5D3B415_9TREE|nr:hypothetical protein B9479_000712 [Cryptococcus floricola]